jgi:hypothetical protein
VKNKSSEIPTNGVSGRRIDSSFVKLLALLLVFAFLLVVCVLRATQPRMVSAQGKVSPGLEPYTPTKIEWMTLECQAALQDYYSLEGSGYFLDITSPDSETVLIYVRYTPQVIREAMNSSIESAHKVIQTIAKRHGWEGWIKIKEDVGMVKKP